VDGPSHVPVLAGEALAWLVVRPDGVYVDCTAGAGGHAVCIAERLERGRLVALDRDERAVAAARERLAPYPQAEVIHGNYGELKDCLAAAGLEEADGVLIDAGVSSMQLDSAERGFSFQAEGPLDMRMDSSRGPSAAEWLAQVTESDLIDTLKRYGDIRPARRIAQAILRRRAAGQLSTTSGLAEAVREGLPFVKGMPEEVRTVFQAIRIAVNEEWRWLEAGLRQAITVLRPGGRIVAISFHSGEDRIVKTVFKQAARPQRELYPDGRTAAVQPPLLILLTPKPVQPGEAEIRRNPRAKSARLRAAERRKEE